MFKARALRSHFSIPILAFHSSLLRGDSMATTFRTSSILISLCLVFVQFLLASCKDNPDRPELIGRRDPYVSGRILIKFRPGHSSVSMTEMAKEFDLQPSSITCGAVRFHTVRPGTEVEAAESFMLDPAVEYAEPDFRIEAAPVNADSDAVWRGLDPQGGRPGVRVHSDTSSLLGSAPNDPMYDSQWALVKIDAASAWKISTGRNVTIAVIDSGVDLDHPEFAARILDGYDFVNEDTVADDDYGHGTLVAGVAAAAANNNRGIAGLAWNARIMPVKVLDGQGQGVSSDLTCALYWAADQGAHIINISIISFGPSFGMQSALNYAANKGVLTFAAAGNLFEQGNPVTYPAAQEGVIAVGATDKDDSHASFSSAGSFVDISAPGVSIYSLFPPSHDEYRAVRGTSLASPHAAALAALVLSAAPGLSSAEVESIILQSAVDLGETGQDGKFGYGRIDASAAMSLTLSSLPVRLLLPGVSSPSPTGTPTATPSATPDAAQTPTTTPSPTATPSE